MAQITFISTDNKSTVVSGNSGNLMELALQNKIEGIEGNCGGVCSCATCHIYVQKEDWTKIGPPNEMESDMLEFDDKTTNYSRLSCQIQVTDAIDGIVVNVAK
ncbi:2Fe-2S iron-sulfur cluster binding domain-containing protein [Cellulophaga sp. E16_2]|uniref:Ferredoxin n=1 Tax=Cellulophaga algicola (strain DSM 14237 / IC166 / ACAM 630) TaxID=688270 RepID=E6XF58_CELAD|nr:MULTISPECIES: 2Fe-2S iron-sulfur cluster-binding protein [Cellulophaga]ADV50294.1 ferredoxin [Cellulophaga algicola DSM 14237]MBO0592696.1 2Fe-2S iron-sulfur cluster binding domain-containing protein [Cellulophaga sp. E16_2]